MHAKFTHFYLLILHSFESLFKCITVSKNKIYIWYHLQFRISFKTLELNVHKHL